MQKRLYNALGLCMKAGKCKSGDFTCETLLKSGGAKLVVIDRTASENLHKKYRDMCSYRDIPLIEADEPGKATGKEERMVVAVTDDNFKRMICDAAAFDERG